MLWKFKIELKRAGVMNLLQLLTSCVKKIWLEDYQKKLKNFPHKRQFKHKSTVMEPSIPFPSLLELVDAEWINIGKYGTLDQPLEFINATSKLEFQNSSAETCDPNPEIVFKQSTDPNI